MTPDELFLDALVCPDIFICGSDFDIAIIEMEVWG